MENMVSQELERVPRGNITPQEVAEVIESIEASGTVPTLKRVRRGLGDRGSFATITKYVRNYRDEQQRDQIEAGERRGPSLPDPVSRALLRGAEQFWNELIQAAQDIIDQTRQRTARKLLASRKTVHGANQRAQHAERTLVNAQTRIVQLEELTSSLQSELSELRDTHQARGHTLDLTEQRLAAAEGLADERNERLRAAATALAKAQQEAERRAEDHQHLQQRHDAQTSELDQRSAALLEERERHTANRSRLQDTITRLEQEFASSAKTIHELEERLQHANTHLEKERTEHRRAAENLTRLQERTVHLSRTMEDQYKNLNTLSATIDNLNQALRDARAVNESLRAEMTQHAARQPRQT